MSTREKETDAATSAIIAALIRALVHHELNPPDEDDAPHTPEPWAVGGDSSDIFWVTGPDLNANVLFDAVGRKMEREMTPEDEANARRVVACVNFLRGVPTRVLELALEARPDVERIQTKGENDADGR